MIVESDIAGMQHKIRELYSYGDFVSGLEMAEICRDTVRDHFGEDHPVYASTLNNLALMQKNLSLLDEAIGSYEAALRVYKSCVGENHASWATTLHNLGGVYRLQAHNLSGMKKVEGIDHALECFEGMMHMTILNAASNPLTCALESLRVRRDILAPDHPDIAISMCNVGMLYWHTHKKAKAEEILVEAAERLESKVGPTSPLTALAWNNLGIVYKELGKFDAAVELFAKATAVRKASLGDMHKIMSSTPRSRGSLSSSRKSRAMILPSASALFLTEVQVNDAGQDAGDDDERLEHEFRSNPLTSYYKSDPEKGFTMDIMMMIDMAKVGSLRDEFQQKERGLSVGEFVHVMLRFVKGSRNATDDKSHLHQLTEPQLVAYLCELFAQIDINGDGSMEWEEFTSFIVDTGLESQQPNSIQMYHHSTWEDTSKHSATIDRMYYFPANDRLAVCEYGTQNLKIYDSRCELQRVIKSPDGFVLCAEYIDKSASGIIYAWDADRMEEKHHMGGIGRDGRVLTRSHDGIVLDLLNLPTLETLASASMDKTVRLWDVNTGKHKQQLDGHLKGVRSLAYSAEYRFLVSAGFDFDAFVWNPYVDQLILRLHGHQNSLCGVEIIPDTPQIITADIGGVFKVWDIRNFACMQTFTAENANMSDIKSFVSVTSHKRLVAGGKRMTLFDYEKLRNPKLTDDFPVFQALFNPISLTFITAAGTDIKIWDAHLGKLLRIYNSTDLTAMCLDNRSRKFIVGDHDGNIKVYDYLNGMYMKCFAYPDTDNKAHVAEVSRLYYCNEYRTVIS
ncbi:hypothetical protein DYB37_012928, partial [Aphanomyces astaci]